MRFIKQAGIRIFLIGGFLAVLFFGSSAYAEEWYEFYEDALKAMDKGEWTTAIEFLHGAIDAEPTPGKHKRMYGVRFIDYYPYLTLGKAYLGIEDFKAASENCTLSQTKGIAPKEEIEGCLRKTAAVNADPSTVFQRGRVDLKPPPKPRSQNVYAVIIGIGDYEDDRIPDLKYTTNDAQGFYDILTDSHHRGVNQNDIKLLLNQDATYKNIKHALGNWLYQQAQEEDTVIIYYSGHGASEEQETYWVTYDADIDVLYSTALNNNEIADMLDRIESKRIITFLDSCYSAATVNRKDPTKNVVTKIPLEKFTGEGKVVISASDGKQVSIELDQYQHGVFTYYLLEGLKREADMDNDGVVVVDEIWNYVKEHVPAAARNRQTPMLQGRITAGIPLTIAIEEPINEKLDELLERGLITQEQYECALNILASEDSHPVLDGWKSGGITDEWFGQLFQCPSTNK